MGVYPDPHSDFGARVRAKLAKEHVIWMTTVGADGTPQPNPVWFVPDGDDLVIYTTKNALRLRHLRRNPHAAFAFNSDPRGDDVVILTGTVALDNHLPPCHQLPAYRQKYGSDAIAISGTEEAFADEYSVPLRATIAKVRGF